MELYGFETDLDIFIMDYNSNYFETSNDVISHILFFLSDYIDYRKNGLGLDLLDYINWSVKNNTSICDFIVSEKFTINSNTITIKETLGKKNFNLLSELHIEEYEIYISNFYFFIKNTKDNQKYMYYLD